MKKIILFGTIALILIVGIVCFFVFRSPVNEKIIVSGNIVDNDKNNHTFKMPQLARIEDRLYWNCSKSGLKYEHGTVELSEDGVKYIDESEVTPFNEAFPNFLRTYKGDLYIANSMNDDVSCYSKNNDSVSPAGEVFDFLEKHIDDGQFRDYYYFEDMDCILYLDAENRLTAYSEGEKEILLDERINHFHCRDGNIYYTTGFTNYAEFEGSGKKIELKRFHLQTKTSEFLCEVVGAFHEFLFDGRYFVTKEENLFYYVDIDTKEMKKYKVSEEIADATIWDGSVYFVPSTYRGAFRFDIEKEKVVKLTSKKAYDCYVVDDYWVYLGGKNDALYRVAQKGSEVETVFSPSTLERIFGPQQQTEK